MGGVASPNSVRMAVLYAIDPDLSIAKYDIRNSLSKVGFERTERGDQDTRCRLLATRLPAQPCSCAHSFSDRSQPTTCQRQEPAGEEMPPTALTARHTEVRATSARNPGA